MAQKYELNSAQKTIVNSFNDVYRTRVKAQKKSDLYYPGPKNQFFDNEPKAWKKFADHCRTRPCLEIGAGPFGIISDWFWLKKPIIIDPLVRKYQQFQKNHFGAYFHSSSAKIYSKPAEKFIPSLKNKISGAIVCRNTLDHTEDPLTVLLNLSLYAKKGCHLLLWTDLWHTHGSDEGHHNITRSNQAFKAILTGLGFKITHELKPIRNGQTVEYGCRAVKQFQPKTPPLSQLTSHDPHA